MGLSKSKFVRFIQCPKAAWLDAHCPQECDDGVAVKALLKEGNEVGDLAMGLFGDFEEITSYNADGSLDIDKMISKTKELLSSGCPVICEASFSYEGLYCAVDILKKTSGGYAIYEVKSSTEVKKTHLVDVAYQRYVLGMCDVPVTGVYIVHINPDYVRRGDIELGKLFRVSDVTETVKKYMQSVAAAIDEAERVVCGGEPNIGISESCFSPYACGYFGYCKRECVIPEKSVLDIYRLPKKQKFAMIDSGIKSFDDVANSGVKLSAMQARQVDYALRDLPPHVDAVGLKKFLGTLSYPLYFLDFETAQPIVPLYDGTRPYEQIIFQYSLHIVNGEGEEPAHKEFLGDSDENPERKLAERLVADIPPDVCVLAYNKAFECERIAELAKKFPDLAERLLCVRANIKDLLDPFRKGYYYVRAMGGSFSIKSVLPALFPNGDGLSYGELDVHNGSEAMALFPAIKNMSPEDAAKARSDLLKYCALDTLAMVKILEVLRAAACR